MKDTGWPPSFSLDGPSIMELLTGDRFYSSADAALREAVLNAIDACGRRTAADAAHQQQILVQFDDATRTVTIHDNGDGMDQQAVSGLFATIGASASRTLREAGRGKYQPVGEFGIGVVSYFLVCSEFELHSMDAAGQALGLVFSRRMFDLTQPAVEIPATRKSQGTTVVLRVVDESKFQLLLTRFRHWVRDVPYLKAESSSRGVLEQGGRRKHVSPVDVPVPEWVEKAEIGAPLDLGVWTTLDGAAHIDVLYRGVFVQELHVPGLWGIEGSLHVNPKKFKPRLNREAFIGEGFEPAMQAFLREAHPVILRSALANMRPLLAVESAGWSLGRWVAVWLAIPRTGHYAAVAAEWDNEFRNIKAFRLLTETGERPVTLAELMTFQDRTIYLVPNPIDSATPLGRRAISVMRAKGEILVQGVQREGGYLASASFIAKTTSEFLWGYFRTALPTLTEIEAVAKRVVEQEHTVATLFSPTERIQLVRMGVSTAPLLRVDSSLWLNVDSVPGKQIVEAVCNRNEGVLGLLVACQQHAPDHINEVVQHLRGKPVVQRAMGPLKRQQLRGLI